MGHTALVTGGSRGIGAEIVGVLRERGIAVIAPSRQEMDLADSGSIARFAVAHREAGIDILVNNAGINVLNPLTAIRDEDWSAMLQINLTAPYQLIKAFAPAMSNWGRILNISSIFSLVTRERRGAYSATKSALNGLTRTAAVELGPQGVLVNALCPGYVNTELTSRNNSPADLEALRKTIPARRLAEPREMAKIAAFLCSEENSYITGQMIVADGGFMCF